MRIGRSVLRLAGCGLVAGGLWAQSAIIEQPDAERTREQFTQLLQRYPPTVRGVLAIDPSLLTNQAFMTPYPALGSFLGAHPEIAHNPGYFIGEYGSRGFRMDGGNQRQDMWRQIFQDLSVFAGLALALGVVTWLIRTLIDYRRWSRLSQVQTEAHTRLLDRFTDNQELLSYIQSPAGSKFLQSTPISLDAGPKSMGAPLGRILWSIQSGMVLFAAGVGLQIAAGQITDEGAQAMHVLGIVGIALGAGFAASAAISFFISRRLGLIESTSTRVTNVP